jgi:hypothetical protein
MESNKLREVVERVVGDTLDAHVAALKSEVSALKREIVERASRELEPLVRRAPAPATSEKAAGTEGGSAADAPTELLNSAFCTIMDSGSQAEILTSLLEGAGQFSCRSALFVIRGGNAVGWRARGFDNNDAIKSVSFDPNSGMASRAYTDRQPVRPAAAEFDSKFISSFGEPQSGTNAIVLPLVLRDKVAALVYADGGSTGKIDPSALECLTRGAGLWLEIVAARKAGTLVAAPEPEPERIGSQKMAAMSDALPTPEPVAPPPPPPVVTTSGPEPAPAPVKAAAATPPEVSRMSPADEEVHKKAKRFAKLLVDEIKLYNQQKVADGRANRDLYSRLKDDIDKSRGSYEKRYGQTAAGPADYFHKELVRVLCDGDPALLGSGFSR